MASQDTGLKKDKYKDFIRLENEGGQESFTCIFCDQKCKSVQAVKSHITRSHKEQIKEKEAEENPEDDLPDVSLDDERIEQLRKEMQQAEKDDENPPAIVDLTTTEAVDSRMVINSEIGQLGTLPEAVERIKILLEDAEVKEDLIKKLETELETSKELANIANGEKESLKIDNEKKEKEVLEYKKMIKYQISINDKLKENGAEPELVKTLKKVEEELKSKTKALEASEKTRKDMIKKVEEEVSIRGNLEADKERLTKTVDALNKLVDRGGSTETAKTKPKCRDVDKPGGCPRAGSCKFYHPDFIQSKDKKQIDCVHWMKAKCKFSDKDCHFKHDKEKKSHKDTKRKRSEDEVPTNEAIQVDFLQGLVRTLAQGSAVEARPGSPVGSAWGMEGQRSVKPRMVSPERSARGMDGQRGSSSYASRTRSPRGMEGQWSQKSYYGGQEEEHRGQEWQSNGRRSSRQDSPARGLDVESLLGQLRGLEQSLQPATQVDKVQEGVQVLMRMLQQTGRR